MKKLLLAATCLGLIAGTHMANAATATGSLGVSAQLTVTCTVNSPSIAFGTIASDAGVSSGSAAINVSCNGAPVSPTIALDTGLNSLGVVATTRALSNGTNFLDYDLYTNAGLTTVWSSAQSVTVSAGSGTLTVYGKIPAAQYQPAGLYSDTVGITLNY